MVKAAEATVEVRGGMIERGQICSPENEASHAIALATVLSMTLSCLAMAPPLIPSTRTCRAFRTTRW
jgi:hypothetical protein